MNAVISTNERAWILTCHVTFKLRFNQIYRMKTTKVLPSNMYTVVCHYVILIKAQPFELSIALDLNTSSYEYIQNAYPTK